VRGLIGAEESLDGDPDVAGGGSSLKVHLGP
jgi:hypothetical protein